MKCGLLSLLQHKNLLDLFLVALANFSCKPLARRILDKIDALLAKDFVPHGAKRIIGEQGIFRIRIGDIRALYRINYDEQRIVIVLIDKRDSVYQ